jgi:hypothetical protein
MMRAPGGKRLSTKDGYDSYRISFHFQRITFLGALSPARQWSFAEDIFLLGRFVRGDEAGMSGWDKPKTGATKT